MLRRKRCLFSSKMIKIKFFPGYDAEFLNEFSKFKRFVSNMVRLRNSGR
jgi:hypothetical protein